MTIPAKAATTTPKSPALTWLPAPWKATGLPVAPATLTEEARVLPAVGPGIYGAGDATAGAGGPAANPTLAAA